MISLICGILKGANEVIYKTEIELQIQEINLRLPEGKRGSRLGVWD